MPMQTSRCLITVATLLGAAVTLAADHTESPAATADRPADIGDIFFFDPTDTDNRLVAMITYGGGSDTNDQMDADFYCDRDVLYSFYIDRDDNGDGADSVEPDVRIDIRMAEQADGSCAVRLDNVPGAGDDFSGSVAGSNRIFQSASGLNAFVGATDDPFFFDSQGFGETLSTGTVSFDSTRDTFGGRNLSAIAFEIDTAALGNGQTVFRAWATTARIVE
ncbi:DUF4331 family protein [Parahaliea mediterranea]|uniref:DUF4331 family protein n=1 Tax=Parahaliea mediterranea TaxID=651086 RepID=UPI000E2F8257|nr:DUF4331 family protein [Parahaliea mediterranea]